MNAVARAKRQYRASYGREAPIVVRAPGRVNLIGEHTDYNDGFALPMALPFDIAVAAHATPGRIVATSEGFSGTVAVDLDDDPLSTSGWATYAHGIAHLLGAGGYSTSGWTGFVASDIPAGASLSSSAALTMAAGLTSLAAAGANIAKTELALLGQRVENEVLGLPSGNLDQLASMWGTPGGATLIDCRTTTVTGVPLPEPITIVIMDTGTRRTLVDSAYAARRADCQQAATLLGVAALRDAEAQDLARLSDPRLLRRARHVIGENARTLAAVEAMRAGDATELGRLMGESHRSLRDDYEVTGPALDAIVELAEQQPSCFGARMTGGGFAGGAVAAVARTRTTEFVDAMAAYQGVAEQPAEAPVQLWPVQPGAGAEVLTPPAPR